MRTVDLRNSAPGEILRQAVLLRSSAGRKASLQVRAGRGYRAGHDTQQWRWEWQLQVLNAASLLR